MNVKNNINIQTLFQKSPLTKKEEQTLYRLLSPKEKNRFQTFKNQNRKQEYLLGHVLLGTLKRQHVSTSAPQHVSYTSLSHSHSFYAAAHAPFPIGIDVQKIENKPNLKKLACRFFSKAENKVMALMSDPKKYVQRFYELWTLKEAYCKASGRPLGEVLGKTHFQIDDQGLIKLVTKDKVSWKFFLDDSTKGYQTAVAVKTNEEFVPEYHRVTVGKIT